MAVIRRLNYQHLLYFWAVVRTGSLTKACEELALSAPTVSAQLRTLEERLGEKLLAKSGRNLVPTEVGKLVFGYANEIFTLGQEMLDALEQRPSTRPLRRSRALAPHQLAAPVRCRSLGNRAAANPWLARAG